MKIFLLIFTALALSACDKDQTPQQTVDQIKKAQEAVQEAAEVAKPHVEAVFDQVIKPAIDQVKSDAAAHTHSKVKTGSAAREITPTRYKRVESGWKVGTSFTHCYTDTWLKYDNIACYGDSQQGELYE